MTQQVVKDGQIHTIVVDADQETHYNIINDDELEKTSNENHSNEEIESVDDKINKNDVPHASSKIRIHRAVKAGKWSANSASDIKANMDAQGISTNALAPRTTYTIQYGDTLLGISRTVSVKMNTLIKINNIINPNEIYAGDSIYLNK